MRSRYNKRIPQILDRTVQLHVFNCEYKHQKQSRYNTKVCADATNDFSYFVDVKFHRTNHLEKSILTIYQCIVPLRILPAETWLTIYCGTVCKKSNLHLMKSKIKSAWFIQVAEQISFQLSN
jgi:hypothetical protein